MSDNQTMLYRPFGPSIFKVTIPEKMVQELNNYVDKIIKDEEKLKELDNGPRLAGQVTQEFKLEKNELKKIKKNFYSESLSEEETKSVIKDIYKKQKIVIDPHTAVAIGVVNKMSLEGNTVVLATAHPSKFSETVMEAAGIKPDLPENLKNILVGKEKYEKLPKNLKKIQNYILERM